MGSRLNVGLSEEDRRILIELSKLFPKEHLSLAEATRRAIHLAYKYQLALNKTFENTIS